MNAATLADVERLELQHLPGLFFTLGLGGVVDQYADTLDGIFTRLIGNVAVNRGRSTRKARTPLEGVLLGCAVGHGLDGVGVIAARLHRLVLIRVGVFRIGTPAGDSGQRVPYQLALSLLHGVHVVLSFPDLVAIDDELQHVQFLDVGIPPNNHLVVAKRPRFDFLTF